MSANRSHTKIVEKEKISLVDENNDIEEEEEDDLSVSDEEDSNSSENEEGSSCSEFESSSDDESVTSEPYTKKPKIEEEKIIDREFVVPTICRARVLDARKEILQVMGEQSGCIMSDGMMHGSKATIQYRGTIKNTALVTEMLAVLCTEDEDIIKEDCSTLKDVFRLEVDASDDIIQRILGNKGSTSMKLRIMTIAKIAVIRGTPTGKIIVIGSKKKVLKAQELIEFIIANPKIAADHAIRTLIRYKKETKTAWCSGSSYKNLPNHGRNMDSDIYTRIVPWPASSFTLLKDKNRATLNEVARRSGGCTIFVNDVVLAGRDFEVWIEGPPDAVDKAYKMILEILYKGINHPYTKGRTGRKVMHKKPRRRTDEKRRQSFTKNKKRFSPKKVSAIKAESKRVGKVRK
eukprot:CAMPEP_0197828210 /NCGR_PEP_ID=MMETSP1437-20131217/4845_1 /TAXON_ID=49252 ORGANISM="Eucampia antarctica, Strain CCMP1452" /NCGR_SAMPLE_ID=MMETSP1437 /ASSEMBLY_ACC=CAM_ASM_001096 /LENGTH=403 /DNA_ID=CAMNT_0043429373 /DNA_START=65 /DNA_END=1276 /DNA_ORIENTATION=+